MKGSATAILVWSGAAVLMIMLPFLMGSWTGFAVALIAAMALLWAGFWLSRPKGDGETEK